ARVVAVDVPSGLCADSGRIIGEHAVLADLTVTFQSAKIGQLIAEGPLLCGKLVVREIGLRPHRLLPFAPTRRAGWILYPPGSSAPGLPTECQLITRTGGLRKQGGHHKYSLGHSLILSGPSGRGGAARLAARGALRIGAGVVTVGCETAALSEHAARLDAVMLRQVAGAEGLAAILADLRINALCLGPGLGVDARGAGLVGVALGSRGEPRATVLDADALTLISQDPVLFGMLHDGCVLTPHAGEFARLFPDIAAKLAAPATKGPSYSKVDATREAAKRAGCVVLFKGPDTVIADPSGRCSINSAHYERAAPWLATAGSGDVLAGFITGLLARGFAPMQAAETAAWLHVECARSFGPGLIAEDLPEELPKVFRGLGL
ncbi:MAG: NAD(P)H-hydrate dehydratase, partial [Paracoccaceae bacterium]